ncbi:MAG: tRNA (adenosine(37)-N6)-threonylcarbamoyltransferase complex transferase subunit TsaD, partial [Christensenellaceae bacterium]
MQYNEMAQAALKKMAGGNAVILAIETSCDETAAAVVRNGREVLGSSIYSQIPVHREYGGVVPELASRNHVEKLPFVVDEALSQAGMKLEDVDALAVTQGPGLVGALLTGVAYAKALAFALKKPLIPVN